jgi:hypothetical protein
MKRFGTVLATFLAMSIVALMNAEALPSMEEAVVTCNSRVLLDGLGPAGGLRVADYAGDSALDFGLPKHDVPRDARIEELFTTRMSQGLRGGDSGYSIVASQNQGCHQRCEREFLNCRGICSQRPYPFNWWCKESCLHQRQECVRGC